MMKKTCAIILVLAMILTLFAGCGKKQEETQPEKETGTDPAPSVIIEDDTEEETPAPSETEAQEPETEAGESRELPDGRVYSYLTGLPVSKEIGTRRPIAVMLNNLKAACPQAGIANAGVVYEVPVEGGIVRLMGVFEDYDDLKKIGSVRSCRPYYVYLMYEWQSVYFHAGQCVFAVPYLEAAWTDTVNANSSGSGAFFRTSDRKAPHNLYTSAANAKKYIEKFGYSQEYPDGFEAPLKYLREAQEINPQVKDGSSAVKITPGYQNNKPWFEYNSKDHLYYRYQFGGKQTDQLTGRQIAYRNVILQICDYSHLDNTAYLWFELQGEGEGYYCTDGKVIPITWKKPNEWGITHFYDQAGNELQLNPGKTWISVIQTERKGKIEIK